MGDRKVLVPVDFGEQSILALEFGKLIASRMGGDIVLLYVVEESGFLKRLLTGDYEKKIFFEAQKALEGLAQEYLQDFRYSLYVRSGKPYEEIETLAKEINPAVIVMGKTEEPSLAKRILGSNTLHVIQECEYPVISVRGKVEIERLSEVIFMPVDLSKPYKEQVNVTLEFAKLLGVKKIFVLSVDVSDDVAYETQLLTGMHRIRKSIEQSGLECETEIVEGKRSEIVDIIGGYVNELKPLLTVIMVHDELHPNEIFIGSIAKRLLERIDYPILSVKPWDLEHSVNPVIKIIVDPMNLLI